ncbi:hypothetical protein AWM70_08260 [Paenibacillus yonginensis]|uniref:Uncharacterized protein n=1 Tax=Paenibacillus yonginensis TaxID=1462996 RepID=A0A1B1MZH2_9BACL|nr:hypothetical protein [Paenibacillus yonginensis]ANS74580.1 hypothetical protein AWM70_08260 [Paenibacillus yonginensis]
MKTQLFDNTTTRNLLQFCYTCTDAHECTTEEACRECWAANNLLEEDDEAGETRELLMEYYA